MSAADFLAAYQKLIASGVSPEDAIKQLQAQNGGKLPTGDTVSASPSSTADTVAKIQQQASNGDNNGNKLAFAGGLTDPFNETFTPPTPQDLPNAPNYTAPTFTPPTYTAPPAFSYQDYQKPADFSYADYQKPADFTAPTAASVLNTPGYQFRLGQGEQALQNSAAAQGLFGTGATLKNILGYGQDYASNEYNNEYGRELGTYNENLQAGQNAYATNRANAFGSYQTNTQNALTAYNTNRSNAVDTYNTNYQTQYIDPYKFAYQGALDSFAPQMAQFQANVGAGNLAYSTQAAAIQHSNDTNYSNAWNSFLFDYNKFRNQQLDTYNKLYPVATA